jgi:hypothetical protein
MANHQPNAARDATLSACLIQLARISLGSIAHVHSRTCYRCQLPPIGSNSRTIQDRPFFYFLSSSFLLLPWGYRRETHQAAIDKNRVTSSVSRPIFLFFPLFFFLTPSLYYSLLSHLLVSFSLALSIIPIVLLEASSRRDYYYTHIHSVWGTSTPPTPRIGENRWINAETAYIHTVTLCVTF